MKPTTIKGSEMRIARHTNGYIYITQDDDIVIVDEGDTAEFVAAIRKHTNTVEEAGVPSHITTGREDLRMTRIIARVKIQQLRRDVAYEEGRISAIDSILED